MEQWIKDSSYRPFSGAADGFCVSVEASTQRQSKIEFDNVMFSKGNMFSIKESDFQVTITISVPVTDTRLINTFLRCPNLDFTISKFPSRRTCAVP